ncbi:MAG: MOSC domain-containing protein [Dinoroseobacter sp.]|nr:MOSC domain-containing protein [Dinoroseobacter sp.]
MAGSLKELIERVAQPGNVAWIGLRPARREAVQRVETALVSEAGLEGDRAGAGKRAVTLFQMEHLAAIASYLGQSAPVDPVLLRRNIGVAGINLISLRGRAVTIGPEVVLRITGPCAPCSRMEEAFGHGGYAAVRGHGGMTAEVLRPGQIRIGAPVTVFEG